MSNHPSNWVYFILPATSSCAKGKILHFMSDKWAHLFIFPYRIFRKCFKWPKSDTRDSLKCKDVHAYFINVVSFSSRAVT